MANKSEVLIIDNDKQLIDSLSDLFKANGYTPFGVYTGQKGLELALNDVFDLILLDSSLSDMSSLELVKRIKGLKVAAPIIALAAPDHLEKAIELSKSGAINILTKPLNDNLVIRAAINAINQLALEKDIVRLKKSLADRFKIIGHSEIVAQFRERLQRVALSSSRALLVGESGTGKRAAAKFIHYSSSRAINPFLNINCATALTDDASEKHRLECDMFGYEQGAFVGADRTTRGIFELADGGTVYLTEVGALPSDLQAKLIRIVESGNIVRLGASQGVKIDVRLLAGSSVRLEDEVKAGHFREDLYFRLSSLTVKVPPLREYTSDVPYLARHILDDAGFPHKRLDPEALEYLKSYSWPGNLRQFKDVIKLAAEASKDDITLDNLKAAIGGPPAIPAPHIDTPKILAPAESAELYRTDFNYRQHVIDFEKRLLEEVMQKSDNNITQAARMLKTDRGNLSKKIKKLGLKE